MKNRAADFSISVFGRFAHTPSALVRHYLFYVSFGILAFGVMSAHIRRRVREQPDT